ncbi:hypothetical protein C2857_000547 [Epichloe festucae Fl1]|uniref:Uncharacterized protein n=1 Tax=Epichloe festucae (strain Fl1) TaxID=877507 RepID=A0A7S9PWW8_EPIFF|nr:hypothetical protein C2857_000547 [Epichloe festucae Fl1]
MAVMSSIRPRAQDSRTHMSTTSEQIPNSPQSSYSSSISSARTSELSGAYVLSRTGHVPPSYCSGSAWSSSRPREEVKDAKDEGAYSHQGGRRQEQERERTGREPSPPPPPTITYFPPSPSASLLSVNTYDSRFSENGLDNEVFDGLEAALPDQEPEAQRLHAAEDHAIPEVLRSYCAGPTDPSLRPSDPRSFGLLFPSQNRLSIRHDDTTPDGNMNLRVDTVTSSMGGSRERRRLATVQLFHLRMHDLSDRHFSLRRYCRDSGREVCFSKRAYASTSATSRHGIQQSVSSALRSVKAPFRRSNASNSSCFSLKSSSSARRPSTASAVTSKSSASSTSGGTDGTDGRSARLDVKSPPSVLFPTDKIKLEFGNYARVEVSRRNSKLYGFEWWGHTYTWKRAVDKELWTFSFHLMRDDKHEAIAHIVQEVQSPSQIDAERRAGGWIPPCYMWISDRSAVDAMTDVADVIVATGLAALVDDCIRQEWQSDQRNASETAPLRSAKTRPGPGRTDGQASDKPFRFGKGVAVY